MADRKPTVLNPAGYQENLQDTDNLIIEAAPTADNHAVNKEFIDDLKIEIDGDIADAGKWEESNGKLYPKTLTNKVGIGTDSPDTNLHVKGSEDTNAADGTGVVKFTGGASNYSAFVGLNAQAVSFGTSNTNRGVSLVAGDEKVRILPNGNVGINTDNPTRNLTINNGTQPQVALQIGGDEKLRIQSLGDINYIDNLGQDLTFRGGAGVTNNVIFKNDGKVGIGVDAPAEKLEVNGNVKADNFIGNVTGNITGNITGNADTATKLKTARNINGTAFDGTSDITTAKWGTARNLNGVSVDGSANKTLDPQVDRDDNTNANRFLTFVDNNTAGYKRLSMDTNLSYNPSTNTLNVNINGNSGNLDGLDSTQFLRSDVSDTFSGSDLTIQGRLSIRGNMDLSDGENLDFGSSDDIKFYYQGSNDWLYCDFKTAGNGIIFKDGGTDRMVLEDGGVFRPSTNNTGQIGNSSFYWNNGSFTNFTVSSTLNVRGAIDLADNDKIRFGSGDDVEMYYNGSHFYTDLKTTGNWYIRDGSTERFKFDKNGDFRSQGNLYSKTHYIDGISDQLVLKSSGEKVSAIHRNDGANYYILLSDASSSATATYNSLRPFRIELSTGDIAFASSKVTVQHSTGKLKAAIYDLESLPALP